MPISIAAIIPTHNRPDLLGRAIGSVLQQLEPVDEIIVVDDADCPETRELVKSFGLNNMQYLLNDEPGASSSRNLGGQAASSDFIAFLDDDDEWCRSKISRQKEKILAEQLDVCFSRIQIVYDGMDVTYSTNASLPENPAKAIRLENFIGGTISSVIRRDLFVSLGGFDKSFRAREEYDLWIRLLNNGAKPGIVEEPLAIAYRSLSKRERISSDMSKYEEAILLLDRKHKALVDELSPEEKRLRYKKQYEFLGSQAVTAGLRLDSFRYYLKAFSVQFNIRVAAMAVLSLISPVMMIRIRARLG